MSIHTLPNDVIHLIAAGEVIDSLAAVVRELCENAIDAGATRITVSLFPDRWRVRVADNGMGIDLADLQQAATAHSTSKISGRNDLFQITSLGFRGEALHSLAQLAELQIYSRPRNSVDGWHLVYNHHGEVVSQQFGAIAPGTAIDVDNLFGDWMARREGLPNLNFQLRQVQMVIYHLALCHPQINWTIEQNHRPWFQIVSSPTAQQIIPQLLPKVRVGDLHHVQISLTEPDPSPSPHFDFAQCKPVPQSPRPPLFHTSIQQRQISVTPSPADVAEEIVAPVPVSPIPEPVDRML